MDIVYRDSSKREEVEVVYPTEMRNNTSLLAQVWQVLMKLKYRTHSILEIKLAREELLRALYGIGGNRLCVV